jgi:hypothetical protein
MKRPDGWSRKEWGLLISIGYVALLCLTVLVMGLLNQYFRGR